MADVGVKEQWLVSPDAEINKMWTQVQIQERKSRIVRYRQDIEDLQKGKIVDLERRIKMLEKEMQKLEAELKQSEPIDVPAS